MQGRGVRPGIEIGRCALPSSADSADGLAERPSCVLQQTRALEVFDLRFDSGPFKKNG